MRQSKTRNYRKQKEGINRNRVTCFSFDTPLKQTYWNAKSQQLFSPQVSRKEYLQEPARCLLSLANTQQMHSCPICQNNGVNHYSKKSLPF